jgi:hypothetical protein
MSHERHPLIHVMRLTEVSRAALSYHGRRPRSRCGPGGHVREMSPDMTSEGRSYSVGSTIVSELPPGSRSLNIGGTGSPQRATS